MSNGLNGRQIAGVLCLIVAAIALITTIVALVREILRSDPQRVEWMWAIWLFLPVIGVFLLAVWLLRKPKGGM